MLGFVAVVLIGFGFILTTLSLLPALSPGYHCLFPLCWSPNIEFLISRRRSYRNRYSLHTQQQPDNVFRMEESGRNSKRHVGVKIQKRTSNLPQSSLHWYVDFQKNIKGGCTFGFWRRLFSYRAQF